MAFGLVIAVCISLLTFALLTTKADHSSDDAIRQRLDSLVNYADQKINNNAERQDRISTDMESQLRILDARIKLLQGRTQ
ncbi:hypothetical protein D5S10_13465 [Pseudomonas savastanoi]|nr:hypothetical protein A3SK_0125075 [Pseudomonas amygdali pv. tabaci str. 6605]KIY19678.1 hypothetical protein RD00_04415 [Pseudomonas amygdali pv. tabaci]QOI04794.1 hypothetical protein D5S10_13465 [Pseudomonas savastanoi]